VSFFVFHWNDDGRSCSRDGLCPPLAFFAWWY
jgi:hypothetical protein